MSAAGGAGAAPLAAPRPAEPPDLALDAPAKINLFLEVLGRRPDGYHEIETVMLAVSLADRVEFWRRPGAATTLSVSGPEAAGVPADGSNLAARAAELLRAEGGARAAGLHLHVEKHVPAGGGLGGGSSDAAAVLRGLNRLWGLGARREDLAAAAARLGSDVAFFLHGGLAVCRGRGERVEPVELPAAAAAGAPEIVLFVPPVRTSTRRVYAEAETGLTNPRRACNSLLRALRREDWSVAGQELFNRLEEPVYRARPELAAARERMAQELSLGVLLSGSGSCIYGLAAPGDTGRLRARFPDQPGGGRLCSVVPAWAREVQGY